VQGAERATTEAGPRRSRRRWHAPCRGRTCPARRVWQVPPGGGVPPLVVLGASPAAGAPAAGSRGANRRSRCRAALVILEGAGDRVRGWPAFALQHGATAAPRRRGIESPTATSQSVRRRRLLPGRSARRPQPGAVPPPQCATARDTRQQLPACRWHERPSLMAVELPEGDLFTREVRGGRTLAHQQRLCPWRGRPAPPHLRRRGSLATAVVVDATRGHPVARIDPGRFGRANRALHPLARLGITPDAGGLADGELAPLEGRNDFGTVGYRRPCPPRRHGRHRYRVRLHAVGEDLRLAPGTGVREPEVASPPRFLRSRSSSEPTNADVVASGGAAHQPDGADDSGDRRSVNMIPAARPACSQNLRLPSTVTSSGGQAPFGRRCGPARQRIACLAEQLGGGHHAHPVEGPQVVERPLRPRLDSPPPNQAKSEASRQPPTAALWEAPTRCAAQAGRSPAPGRSWPLARFGTPGLRGRSQASKERGWPPPGSRPTPVEA
jgi:Phosphatidylethanolamine-binding protein